MSQDKNQYKHMLNLPATDFPMKAGLAQREPQRLMQWQDADVYGQIHNRVSIFVSLPIASLDKLTLQKRLDEIGQRQPKNA